MTSSDLPPEERCDYIVSGFVRPDIFLPSTLIAIIIQYFRFYFEWDAEKYESHSFSMDNTYVSSSAGNTGIWTAKNVVDAKKCSSIEWEVTLKSRPTPSTLCFAIGFVEQSIMMLDSWKAKVWLGNENKEQSIVIYTNYPKFEIRKVMKCVDIAHEKALPKSVMVGDRFELRFDLISNQCSFYYNEEFMDIMCDSLPKDAVLVPAMCCSSRHDFQTTKWVVQYGKNSD